MKKIRKYFLSPDRKTLLCHVYINGSLCLHLQRNLETLFVVARGDFVDVTTFDLELHSFLRVTHQYIIDKDSVEVKIEDMFEMENPNI